MKTRGTEEPEALQVLANEQAGIHGGTAKTIEAALEEGGVVARVRSLPPSGLARAIGELVGAVPVIGVCGGDGTLMAAAEILAGTETTLAVIPTGTLNHFARRVGIEDVEAAVAAIASGGHVSVPVGIVDDRLFLNTATFGLYADVVRRRERLRPWLTKWPAAGVGLVQRLLTMRRLRVTLDVGGERIERDTPLVWMGIGWGSFPRVYQSPERRSTPDLEIVVLRPRGRFGVVGLGFRFIRHVWRGNRPVEDPALEVLHSRSIIIHADRPIGVTMDGEVVRLQPPVFVGVVDHALRVTAPEEESS